MNGFTSGALGSLAASLAGVGHNYDSIDAQGHMTNGRQAWSGLGLGEAGQIGAGVITGGVSAELSGGNFWQGAVSAGIVAGLNHAMHAAVDGDGGGKPKGRFKNQEKDTFKNISETLSGLGLGTDAKLVILNMAKAEDLIHIVGYLKGMAVLSKGLGYGAIAVAGYQYMSDPTTANLLNLIGTTSISFFAGPAGSLAAGLLDVSGASGYVYDKIGGMIDNFAGYSVGKSLYNSISPIYNNLKMAK